MIHIVIPMLPSPEFPGRALQLWPYTMNWLATELLYIGDSFAHAGTGASHRIAVSLYGRHADMPARIPAGWTREYTGMGTWQEAVVEADTRIIGDGDVTVLVRPETPFRERGLLERVLEAVLYAGAPVATTDGRKKWDGQLLAWMHGQARQAATLDCCCPLHSWAEWTPLDISLPPDIPPGLPGMATSMLLAPAASRPIPPLLARKVLLVGSGRDLAGRKMGAAIDAGEHGLVVRCNKYYGDPEDVGRTTDIAVVRWLGWEHAYFQNAPAYPDVWITVNDGKGIPRSVVAEAVEEVGHPTVSCGIIAAKWLLGCGADVSVIGMGRNADGSRPDGSAKVYVDGTKDNNPHYDWAKEDAWWDAMEGRLSLV